MKELKRFDIAGYNDVTMVVIESDLLPPDPAIVVIPLLINYPAIPYLNPTLYVDGCQLILATRLITSVRRAALQQTGTLHKAALSMCSKQVSDDPVNSFTPPKILLVAGARFELTTFRL